MKILAVIVNYKAALYCISAVKSVKHSFCGFSELLKSNTIGRPFSLCEAEESKGFQWPEQQEKNQWYAEKAGDGHVKGESVKGVFVKDWSDKSELSRDEFAKESFSLKIVVVDNSVDKNQAGLLAKELDDDAHLIVNSQNEGFGRACNRAFNRFDSDLVLLLNPDARLLPGALLQMTKTLVSDPCIAAVSPRIFWDDNCEYLLPPSMPLWFSSFVSSLKGDPFMVKSLASRLWQIYALKYWKAEYPFSVSNMSGGAVLLKREPVVKSGGLFDENFFLYYEDTDLFLRLKRNRYILLTDPAAGAVHYYDQCGTEELMSKRRHMADSENFFYRKHSNSAVFLTKKTADIVNRLGVRFSSLAGKLKNLSSGAWVLENIRSRAEQGKPDFISPFSVNLPFGRDARWLFEWSPDPFFLTSAAAFGTGNLLVLPEDKWKMFSPGVYYGRITRLGSGCWGNNMGYSCSCGLQEHGRGCLGSGKVKQFTGFSADGKSGVDLTSDFWICCRFFTWEKK